ncbi:hypothetical protein [Solirubrum puertoriconensis]|uniref:Uncharacterized protein n=1 Tax=Solirubrum puertoriconensis TaxID=1751427 RepID=A0A9X0L4C5_SOLP1|nr:hypothetical protein [Solirubrum puertoriconensis]KUG07496.1 hypothetical protein ASU33_14215 [Solirubrum puertoriconensis]
MANASKFQSSGVFEAELVLDETADFGMEIPFGPPSAATVPEAAADAMLCGVCGEPLGWHETSCLSPQPEPATITDDNGAIGLTFYYPSAATFAFDLGQAVQAAYNNSTHRIIWRGQVKERHPATGLVHRVNVYRLNDGYWDCYREDDLQAA